MRLKILRSPVLDQKLYEQLHFHILSGFYVLDEIWEHCMPRFQYWELIRVLKRGLKR